MTLQKPSIDRGLEYIRWQNRSFDFYLAARVLYRERIVGPAAFAAYQSLESGVKATLIFHVDGFKPKKMSHDFEKMLRKLKKRVAGGDTVVIPQYFYAKGRYQSNSRYPWEKGSAFLIPGSFLSDLDSSFVQIVKLVPQQVYNSNLGRALKNSSAQLSDDNLQIGELIAVFNK